MVTKYPNPVPNRSEDFVMNDCDIRDFSVIPDHIPRVSESLFRVLGRLYERPENYMSYLFLKSTPAGFDNLCKLGLVSLGGDKNKLARITRRGKKAYEFFYYYNQAKRQVRRH